MIYGSGRQEWRSGGTFDGLRTHADTPQIVYVLLSRWAFQPAPGKYDHWVPENRGHKAKLFSRFLVSALTFLGLSSAGG